MSDYNVDTLENKIVVEAEAAVKNLTNLVGGVKELKNALNEIQGATGLKSIDNQAKKHHLTLQRCN